MRIITLLSIIPMATAGLFRSVKPKVRQPSGPVNVTLDVVSRTELGVSWEPPLFDGGKAITKYLVEWDTDKYMTSGIASPSNPYGNAISRSEVVSGENEFRIAGLEEGQQYYVRVSAFGEGYSRAISSDPPYAVPSGMLPGYLTDVSLDVATDSDTADRLRLAWSAPEVDVNGFSVLPSGCAGGESPPSAPDTMEAYRVMWDTHPSFSNALTYDVPAVVGDGSPLQCCPSTVSDDGVCHIELGAEVQSFKIQYPQSSVPSSGDLFDSGAVRIAYVGSQSKSIQVETPMQGSMEVRISPSSSLPASSPISVNDLIRIQGNVYLVSNVDSWPGSINISSEYVAASVPHAQPATVQAYFATPPSACFDLSSMGNSAESLRSHISSNFDDSPFDESISVSRSTMTEPFASGDSIETRIVGYEYHVTFSGQGFSSILGSQVEELVVISDPSSSFSTIGGCGVPFVSDGIDVSSMVSTEVSTKMESGSISPGRAYYVQVAGVNANGVGPFVPAVPEAEVPMSQPGLAQNCQVSAMPTVSSSLKVEWNGVRPYHGQAPSSYKVDFYDFDSGASTPVATEQITDIDESTRYSITKDGLTPGTRYKVLIVPVNDLGEGGPSWFSGFNPVGLIHDNQYDTPQDYLEKSCHAVPVCESRSVECDEVDASNFAIIARSLPPPPEIQVGTYPSVVGANWFTKDSVFLTFESSLSDTGVPTDKFLIEWSTRSSFLPLADEDVGTLWSTEVVAQYSDVNGENAYGDLHIDSLDMGTQYFVRVSAHNTAGYGFPSSSVPIKAMTRPDPPFEPVLSSLSLEQLATLHPGSSLTDSAITGTSLLVSWQPPKVDATNDRPDLVGDGGDDVTKFLVEWSRIAWNNYSPTVYEINLQTSAGVGGSGALGILTGSFRLLIDTTVSSDAAVSGSYVSASIPVDVSSAMLKTVLENIPNVGEVKVVSPQPLTWRITFVSEVGDIDMTLQENNLLDDTLAVGNVDVTKVSVGSIPTNAVYGSEETTSTNYIIEHLVPGMKIFVRVSASNQVGFGPRRKTAPEFSSPQLQRPDDPTSLYSDDVPPFLSVFSPTALKVHVGPPFYDGGSPLTSFLIEWDSSPTFDSSALGDGSSLGSTRVEATTQVCSSCVNDFDWTTNTFTYVGSAVTAELLMPQRKIMVYFDDDAESYLFTVLSATSSTITVSSQHLRVTSHNSIRDKAGGLGGDLEILGTTHVIDGLDTGRAYYVRVSSENGEMGTGKSVATMPPRETPRGFPLPPSTASITIVDKNSLSVSWSSDAHMNDPSIQAYKVERFIKSGVSMSSTSSFFGEQEVVEISTVGLGLVGGTFHLYFGGFDSSTNVFLGAAKAINGLGYVETEEDLSPHLHRGEPILIGSDQYTIHETEPFTSNRLPLSDAYPGSDAEAISIYARSKSMPIPYDASEEEVRNVLEQMPNVNHVDVRREVDEFDGYQYFVTFVSNVGPQPTFSVDTSKLIGTNPLGFTITRSVVGIAPDDYSVTMVQDPTVTSFDIKDLLTGQPYYIRVSSVSDKGDSLPVYSLPMPIAPGGVPGEVSPPSIQPLDESNIVVTFEADVEDNGAPVEEYIIEASVDPSFGVDSTTVVNLESDHRVQRITTKAHSIPWDDSSSFTLSLGDFHGDFTVPVGQGTTTVRVQNGDNILERSTGILSLSSAMARGDFLSVGGLEFRVCLSDSHLYDDTHLTLCSKDNALDEANFHIDSPLTVIDELPIFILDTSLGAAKSPALGDVFLQTVDASGSPNDTHSRLRRGDLIRVGHPQHGETFRVSTDLGRDFTDRIVPLGSEGDANIPASLSSEALEHSTYEVQSYFIRSSSDSVTLTPSNTLSSGFRIRYKTETTETTTAGGDHGCLTWDADAIDVKTELETLVGIDSVIVTKEDLTAIPGSVGAGVKYYVTFTGLNVRGSIPPLQIVDVGSNGCLDAHSLGGTFGQDIAPITVEQVETSYIPFYEIQTTTDIPYDASAADVKAALEDLSLACTVDVARTINRHGYSWDVTFIEGSPLVPLLPISANGANLLADIDPRVTVVDVARVEVPADLGGAPYFVRVAALNSFGMGPYTMSNPRAIEVSPQPPSEPVDVFAEPLSDTEILVQWNPPLETGGRPVTHYKVEYDELSSFSGGLNSGSISLSSSSTSTIYDVQTITVRIDNGGLPNVEAYLSGTFSLSFNGQKTDQLPHNASPEEVKASLEELCNIVEVQVTRTIHCSPDPSIGCMTPEGYTWIVTFVSASPSGDQHHRPTSKLSSRTSHKLSIDGSYLFECSDVTRTMCNIGGSAVASVGTVQEVQSITLASSPFSVTVLGETSDVISIGDSISDIEKKLNSFSMNGVGKISVSCPGCVGGVIASVDTILLKFLSFRGDLPPVSASDPAAIVAEVTKGSSQFVVGRATYSTVVSGLTSVNDWYVRVFAYNGAGEGPPELVWPSPLRLTTVAPQVPEKVSVAVQDATSLRVSWDRPISDGGVPLSSFIVEYDTTPAFSTQNGMPLGRLMVVEADADASIGIVATAYPDSSDPILRKRIIIDDADVISQGVIGVGSILRIGMQTLTVLTVNEDGCGVTCLTMDEDYTGTSSSGMKIYSGPDAKHYSFDIQDLIPGVGYHLRVAAANAEATSSFSFPTVYATPMDVPNVLSWAKMTTTAESDKLRLDYGPPVSSDKPYGANGSPTSQYHVEVATAEAFRPETISLSTKADTTVSGYIEISVGYQGDYDMLISVANQPAQLMVNPGSRWVDTMGADLTSSLHPGETIVIEEEYVEVRSVLADKIELNEYHVRGTNGVAVSGYRMNNYIGSATLSPGDSTLVEENGQSLESVLKLGDVFEVTTDVGGKEYLTATSVTGSSVSFSPSFSGTTITTTPIHTKKRMIISANSSSGVMQASVESLRDVGSVEVERDGPNSSDGFAWRLRFSSNMGMSPSCSVPSWCFAANTETVSYISVSNTGDCDGNYVQTSFHDGRPKYELLGKSCHILHESSTSEWNLVNSGSVLSTVFASSVSVPLSGWSNSVSIVASSGAIPLLVGQSAVAEVTVVQGGVEQLFTSENVVYSAGIDIGQLEVQEIELLSDEDDLRGSFELSLGTMPQKITLYHDESTDDFKTKLESLSGVGRVLLDSTSPPEKFGRVWTVTFLSNSGDVPLLRHGISNLQGTSVALSVREVAKGSIGPQHITVDGLQEGETYAARIQAKNEAGSGAYTTASQPFGGGVHPMSVSVSSTPDAPSLSTGIVTKSRADIKFTKPSSNGSEITSYKFEWTTSDDFGTSAEARARVSCSDASEMLGAFQFVYGHETSVPINIRADADEISKALGSFRHLNEIEVSVVTNELSELEWDLKFLHDIGPRGTLSMDAENLRCQSEEPLVESSLTMTTEGSMPEDYGTQDVFTDELTCGSIRLAEFSDEQHLMLTANAGAVTGGSYQLLLDGEATECIPIDATATQMRDALENLAYAGMVDVVATSAPIDSHFPLEYKITFTGKYAYGDWPALQIIPAHFGAGECELFVGGTDHRAAILPLRDESHCLGGAPETVAIVVDSITAFGGYFGVSFGGSSENVSVEASASEMKDVLTGLMGTDNVHVTKHGHGDMGEGVAWAVTYPRTDNKDDQIRVVDTFVTGKNAKVEVYPVLTVQTFSPVDDMSGDFRLAIDGEKTAPLSHQASQKKVLQEMHRLNGIGKVNMLGPVQGYDLTLLEFNALVDDSFIVDAQKAISIVGDLASTLAEGDPLVLGTCELKIKSVEHEEFDATQSAGLLYDTLYAASPETANAKTVGFTTLKIQSGGGALNFLTDCSQSDGVSELVKIGAVSSVGNGVNHDMIVKSYTTNLDHIEVLPERNWRGTAPRIFFKSPSGIAPQTFTLTEIDHEKLLVRASARNSQGFGLPSSSLQLTFSSTVPESPTNVLLLAD